MESDKRENTMSRNKNIKVTKMISNKKIQMTFTLGNFSYIKESDQDQTLDQSIHI